MVGKVGAVAVVDEGGGAADGVGNVVKEAADALDDLVDGVDVHHGDDVFDFGSGARVRLRLRLRFRLRLRSIHTDADGRFQGQCWRKSLWPPSTASTTAATTSSVVKCGGNGGDGGGSRRSRKRTRRYRSNPGPTTVRSYSGRNAADYWCMKDYSKVVTEVFEEFASADARDAGAPDCGAGEDRR